MTFTNLTFTHSHGVESKILSERLEKNTRLLELLPFAKQQKKLGNIAKPELSDHIEQEIFLAFHEGGCLLLHEMRAESYCL